MSIREQLNAENKTIMDIVQMGLHNGSIKLDGDVLKNSIADIVAGYIKAGAGVTVTIDSTLHTITIKSP